MEFRATTRIEAPAQDVWEVLTDLGAWVQWDPHVTGVDGVVAPGSKVTVRTSLSDRAFPVKVAELVEPKLMVWKGGMPLGLFTGTRTFTLDEVDGTTTYTVHEVFTGPLTNLIGRSMPDLQPSFDAHVAGLRQRVESA